MQIAESKNAFFYILDTETTGLDPYWGKLLELAIIELDLWTSKYETIFNKTIKWEIDDDIKESWIIENGFMKIEDLQNGIQKEKLQSILQPLGRKWTSFNVAFDYSFLKKYGLQQSSFCLMEYMAPVVGIWNDYFQNWKWPSLKEAYKFFDLPVVEQNHRALDDTIMATEILIKAYNQDKQLHKRLIEMVKNGKRY